MLFDNQIKSLTNFPLFQSTYGIILENMFEAEAEVKIIGLYDYGIVCLWNENKK